MRPLSLKNILVATDMTDAMLPALCSAAELARLADARLHIIHVGAPSDEVEQNLKDQLRRASCGLELAGTRIAEGPPDEVISEEAARVRADVIVLGPHDRAQGATGTATRVVRRAEVPCLILPVALPLPLTRVLVPLDASEAARGALAVGLTWASALRSRPGSGRTRLVAYHVVEPGAAESDPAKLLDEEVAAVRLRFAQVAGVDLDRAIETGETTAAAGMILRRAETEQSDLVVLGTHGDAEREARLGSVSSAVVGDINTPVLLVSPAVWRAHGAELSV